MGCVRLRGIGKIRIINAKVTTSTTVNYWDSSEDDIVLYVCNYNLIDLVVWI